MTSKKHEEPAEWGHTEKKAPAGHGKYHITLEHAPTLVIEAESEAAAWEEYKKQAGLYAEPWHKPVITRLTEH